MTTPESERRGAGVTYKYAILLYWSDEDGVFVGEAPELPGCMAHGDTQEDTLCNLKNAMALWIDTAHEFGRPAPAPGGCRPFSE